MEFSLNQEVEIEVPEGSGDWMSGVITEAGYLITLSGDVSTRFRSSEAIREKLTVETAWVQALALIKDRWVAVWNITEQYDRETRHQVYRLLGRAMPITDEVKSHVKRYMELVGE